MLEIARIKEMVGISGSELLRIRDNHTYLKELSERFYQDLSQWLASFPLGCEHDDLDVILEDFYEVVISGDYGSTFYKVQYHQAMRLHQCGVSLAKTLLMLSYIRKLFIIYVEPTGCTQLAKGLCHVLDMSQSIMAGFYQIAEEVKRMRGHVDNECKRIERSFGLISMKPSIEILRPYLDHQEWKFMAFSAAVGEALKENEFELSHTKCQLAKWLESGGTDKIPASDRTSFFDAHKKIHQLGQLALEFAVDQQPERVLELLMEMDAASSIVSDVLLNVIEDEFIRLATSDALTGMPNKRSFDLEFEKKLAFAERQGCWIGLVLIDVDHFKAINDRLGHLVGDNVLREIAVLIKQASRIEETAYRWGGDEFAIVSLDEKPGGAERLAERIRLAVERHTFCQGTAHEMKLSVSCGSVCFQPPINAPAHEIFAMVDQQLYKAKAKGRNCVEHLIIQPAGVK